MYEKTNVQLIFLKLLVLVDNKNIPSFTVQLYSPADFDWSDCMRHLDNKTTGPREYITYKNNLNTYT